MTIWALRLACRHTTAQACAFEIGDVSRFLLPEHLASCAGLVPRVNTNGRTRMDQLGGNVSRMLKWAFVEAANLVVLQQRRMAHTRAPSSVSANSPSEKSLEGSGRCGQTLRRSCLLGLRKQEVYQEPTTRSLAVSSTHGNRDPVPSLRGWQSDCDTRL
jgi:hypothetical protein